MIYVSIPVHEKLDVIKNQADNFKKYLPEAMIVLHLSTKAEFNIEKLVTFIKSENITNVLVNPTQVDTAWGSIIRAHVQNILFILDKGDATKICFHSSNDMLVRYGLYDYIKDRNFIFHNRIVRKNSYWWVGNVALDDYRLMDWLAIHGGGQVIASQIEGSMYHIDFLQEMVDELLKYHPVLDSELFYPREEIFFSSFATAKGLKSEGMPYIFSEVHRFDEILWEYFDKYSFILNDKHKITRKLKKQFNDKLFAKGLYKIQEQDIDAIRNQDKKYLESTQSMSDGGNLWQIHNIDNLYGVKRVERDMNNKLRQYISG